MILAKYKIIVTVYDFMFKYYTVLRIHPRENISETIYEFDEGKDRITIKRRLAYETEAKFRASIWEAVKLLRRD